MDQTSEEFLASLADSLSLEPMMLLATYRPGYQPPWTGRSYATQLSLPRLAPGHRRELVRRLLPSQLRGRGRGRRPAGRGNPFFLEELARVVQGATHRVHACPGYRRGRADGAHRPAPRRRQERPPDRVRPRPGVLDAAAETRWDGATSMHSWSSSKRLEFLHELGIETSRTTPSGTPHPGGGLREPALGPARRAVHAAAARALEALHRGRLEQVYDRLADHWYRAEEAEPAVEFLSRFAAQAASAYAHVEASEALRKALAQVGRLPEEARTRRRVELVLALARLYFMGRFHESIAPLGARARGFGPCRSGLHGPLHRFWLAHTQSHLGRTRGGAARAGGARRG